MFTVVPFVPVNYMFVIATTKYTKYTKNKRGVLFGRIHCRDCESGIAFIAMSATSEPDEFFV